MVSTHQPRGNDTLLAHFGLTQNVRSSQSVVPMCKWWGQNMATGHESCLEAKVLLDITHKEDRDHLVPSGRSLLSNRLEGV